MHSCVGSSVVESSSLDRDWSVVREAVEVEAEGSQVLTLFS